MKPQKNIALILTFAFILGLLSLTGCNSSNSPSGSVNNSSGSNSAKSEDVNNTTPDTDWPKGTVTINCAFGAGGDTDTAARVTAEYLTKYFGQTFIVTNVTGAGGATAAIEVMGKAPDGYNLLFTGETSFVVAANSVDFSYIDDFTFIGSVGTASPNILLCSADNPYGWETLDDVLTYIKDHPGEISISDVPGTAASLFPSVLQKNGYDVRRLDVGSGGADRFAALLGGQVDLCMISYMTAAEYIKSGDLIPLADGSYGIEKYLPGVPNIADFGLGEGRFLRYYKLLCDKDVPQGIVDKLDQALAELVQEPEFAEALEVIYCTAVHLNPEESVEADLREIDLLSSYMEYIFPKN